MTFKKVPNLTYILYSMPGSQQHVGRQEQRPKLQPIAAPLPRCYQKAAWLLMIARLSLNVVNSSLMKSNLSCYPEKSIGVSLHRAHPAAPSKHFDQLTNSTPETLTTSKPLDLYSNLVQISWKSNSTSDRLTSTRDTRVRLNLYNLSKILVPFSLYFVQLETSPDQLAKFPSSRRLPELLDFLFVPESPTNSCS